MYLCYNRLEEYVSKKPKHDENLLAKIKKYVANGKYRVSKHAIKRQNEREINLPKVLYVLTHGYHEENKSLFDTKFQTWKYAIRGKTIDGIDARIVIAFADDLIIITVIRVT